MKHKIQDVWTILLELSKNSVSEILKFESMVIQINERGNMNNLIFNEEILDIEFDFGIYMDSKEMKFY